MKKVLVFCLLVFTLLNIAFSQRNVLVLEKPGNRKSFKYFEGDKIELQTTDSVTFKGMISAIKDTTIMLDFYTELSLKKIKTVFRTRWAVSIISKVLMIGGAGLVLVTGVNEAISGSGNVSINNLYYGAAGAAAGALLIPLQKARYVISPDKWKLKILQVDKEFDYQKNKTIRF